MLNLVKVLKIPIKKVAIELNQEIIEKINLNKIVLKKNDKVAVLNLSQPRSRPAAMQRYSGA